eukprot:TRINITY_DN781826_c0_g1_i1.p1 TRINITY_DN781826_c0_g1~~TRINITY_DN781826_c0_g1_i1.p1  ORF type:complete len:530 (+),score=129.99 TRINITY_DN781826_c0_g1_i1:67-1656(+)
MVDLALIGVAIVVPIILFVVNGYFLVLFQHPEDKNTAYIPKIVVLLGFLITEIAILMLPFDAGNKSGVVGCGEWNDECGEINVAFFWQVIYIAIAVFIFVVIPFATFRYEADDGEGNKNEVVCWTGIKYTIVCAFVGIAAILITYAFLGKTKMPVDSFSVNAADFLPVATAITASNVCGTGSCEGIEETLEMDLSIPIYIAAFLSFVGWFFFILYAGVGVVTFPLDAINSYRNRPKIMNTNQYFQFKIAIQNRAKQLLEAGRQVKEMRENFTRETHTRKEKRTHKKKMKENLNRLSIMTEQLNADHNHLMACQADVLNRSNPLVPIGKLLAGIGGVILSAAWLFHIVAYMLFDPPLSQGLNTYLTQYDTWFPLFGTLSIGVLAMYLLVCVIKGGVKYGVRFLFFKVHPMRINDTLMSSFLFNTGLIMLCSLPVVQFCTQAFADYIRLTDVQIIFGTQIRYMEGFRYFFNNNVFVLALLGMSFLSLIYVIFAPSDRDAVIRDQSELISNLKSLSAVDNIQRKSKARLSKL